MVILAEVGMYLQSIKEKPKGSKYKHLLKSEGSELSTEQVDIARKIEICGIVSWCVDIDGMRSV